MRRKQLSRGQVQRRKDVVYAVLLTVALAGFAFLVLWAQSFTEDLRTANEARDALARQVQQLGGTPVAGSPGSRGEVGPSGPPGPSGLNGSDGQPGADSTVPGPTGPAGADGKNGVDGQDGQPGADSTVPGPVGPAGPPGPAGADGANGTDGRNGTDGQTCPDGYSLRVPKWDEDILVCTRDETPDQSPASMSPLALAVLDRRRF